MLQSALPATVFVAFMLRAVATDLARMTISNRLCVLLAVAFLPFALLAGAGAALIGLHVLAALAALALCFGCFAAGWMGGGDAKLVAATALWLGPSAALAEYALLSALLGGVLTLALLVARRLLAPATGSASIDRLLSPATGVPYGVALGGAGILVCLSQLLAV